MFRLKKHFNSWPSKRVTHLIRAAKSPPQPVEETASLVGQETAEPPSVRGPPTVKIDSS
jgi:hypothetical protein